MADLIFGCTGVRPDTCAVTPSMFFALRITEVTGQRVGTIALRCQIRIEPARRRYSEREAQRLSDLFGDTARWAETLKPMQLATVSTMVPGFSGSIETDLRVPFSYDLQVGTTRYFTGLEAGEIPLLLLFSGTVFAPADGRPRIEQVPWNKEARVRLPLSAWQEAIDAHFPGTAWITMSRSTLADLLAFKSARALPTWDSTMSVLLRTAVQASEAGHDT